MVQIISIKELRKLIEKKGDYVLIDVRERGELVKGMIPTAINIPFRELKSYLVDSQRFDKGANLIFYCRTGSRSQKACEIAISLGFVNTRNYEGSIKEWSEIDSNVKYYELKS